MSDSKSFFVETMFGAKTRQPIVRISYGPEGFTREIAQIPPEDAISLAMNLLQASQASLTDAFLVSFLEQRIGAEPEQVFGILKEFRDWRMGREAEA
jgi:hypothetical protein